MNSKVQTVTGPLAAEDLGLTLAHEHVALRSPGVRENWPETYSASAVRDLCEGGLTAARISGVESLLEHTTFDLGRDPVLLRELSLATGMKIVATTGVWVNVPRFFHNRKPSEIAQLFVGDIRRGIAGTGVKAGMVKCAVESCTPAPATELIIEAVALTHQATGVPATVHTNARARSGLYVQRRLMDLGVPANKILIGHSGDTTDLDYLREMLRHGSFLGMDRFGVHDVLDAESRLQTVASLCAEGFASQLMLAHDANCWSDKDSAEHKALTRPDWNFRYVPDVVVPQLAERGVSSDALDQMLRANPAALFR